MKRKFLSIFVLVAFLNYMQAGCSSTNEYKILKEEIDESIYSQRIVKVVLRSGEVIEFSTSAAYKKSPHYVKGFTRDGKNVSLSLDQYDMKEIRISKPESIPVNTISGLQIYEIVFSDQTIRKSMDGIWFYNQVEKKLLAKRNSEIVYQCSADSISDIRISASAFISEEELIKNPDTHIFEILSGNRVLTFDDRGGFLEKGTFSLTGRSKGGEYVDIPDEKILYVKVERYNAAKAILSILGGLILVAGVIILIVLETKQSCPFVYSYTGDKYIFDAEPLGGAVAKGLQKIDYSRLEHLRDNNGKYQLLFKNEVRETQYLDEIKLHVFDHEEETTIIPDVQGNFYKLYNSVKARGVYDEKGQDLSLFLNDNDGIAWQTYLPRGDTTGLNVQRHQITLTFPKPIGVTYANLIFNGGTALWGSNMIRKMLELRGDHLDSWYQGINSHGPEYEELLHFTFREELYLLKVYIKNNDEWLNGGFLPGGGPLITEDRIIPLDLSKIEGDELIIRLDPPPGFWQIDYIAVNYGAALEMCTYQIPLGSAIDHEDNNVSHMLSASDGNYHEMPRVGDWFKAEFDAPAIQSDKNRSIFLETNGYYVLHIDKTKPEETVLIKELINTPGEIVNYSIERYFEWYNQQVAAN
jgi:hypothetical protein